MGSIFGGQKQSSQSTNKSYNEAYPFIQETYGKAAGNTTKSMDALSAMLGIGGDIEGQNAAFQNFKNSSGYNFIKDEAMGAITDNKAASGLLRSGSYGTALQSRAGQIANLFLNDYLSNLNGQAQLGIGIGQLISGAGQRSEGQSTSKGKSKPGLGGLIGGIASGIAGGG